MAAHVFDVTKNGKVIFSGLTFNEAYQLANEYGGMVSRIIKTDA